MTVPDEVTFESRWVDVDGHAVHVRYCDPEEPESSIPIVLMHGLGVSSRHWMRAARGFAARHRVFAPDLPGYGLSPKPRRSWDVRQLAEGLVTVMDRLHIDAAAVLGVSFGCQVVIDLAVDHPLRVRGLCLVAPTMDPSMGPFEHFFKLALDGTREPLALFPVIARDYATFGIPNAIATFNHAYDDDVLYEAAHVDAPTLVIRGSRDPIVSQPWCERLVGALPQGRLEVVEGAAHATNFNAAGRVVELMERFLEPLEA